MAPPKVQILRTPIANNPPASLLEGELSIEMSVPTRLWVGVPVTLDPSGKKLLFDSTYGTISIGANPPTAPSEGDTWYETDTGIYWIWSGGQWVQINGTGDTLTLAESDARYVNVSGDTMTGPLFIDNPTPSNAPSIGALTTKGGIGVGQNVNVAGNIITLGQLLVSNPFTSALYLTPSGGTGGYVWGRSYANDDAQDLYLYDIDAAAHVLRVASPSRDITTYGALMLAMDPIQPLQAATKQYVDNVAGSIGTYVLKAGDVMTGFLTLNADPTAALHAATKQYVDAKATGAGTYVLKTGDTMTGGLVATNLNSTGELVTQGGVVRLNAAGNIYMQFDNTNINLLGAPVLAGSGLTANGFLTANGPVRVNGARVLICDGAASDLEFCDLAGTVLSEINYDHSNGQFAILHNQTGNSISFLGGGVGNFRYVSGGTFLCFDALPTGQFNVNNSRAVKTGGGMWMATSDERIKTVIGPYRHGLDEVLQLDPVRYRYNGNYNPPDTEGYASPHDTDQDFIGLVAQQAEVSMPELVTKTRGFIDGKAVDDLRELDATALIYALVNSVKELSERLEALERNAAPKR